jgi:hypothetical protein
MYTINIIFQELSSSRNDERQNTKWNVNNFVARPYNATGLLA